MGVQLNIKDAETVRMARELAQATGQPITQAIRGALARELEHREAEIAARIARVDHIVTTLGKKLPEEWRGRSAKDIMDAIHDENGMPR
jgi:antitoxin VapB